MPQQSSGAAPAAPGGAYDVFPGEGEMASRCRALDWSATSLGPVEAWPAALRWAVRTALESPFPINLWCGPELVLIYNDGYRHVLGSKHPAALGLTGREVWREIWGEIEPMFRQIQAGGPAVYADDAPFVIERDGASAEGGPNAWFTFALSPVRDESGTIVAFLNVVSETTGRILAERATEAARREAEAAEARLRDVFIQAPSFMAVLRGSDFVFEFVNEAYYQLVGHRELLGRPVFQALPEVRGQGFEELLTGVLSTGAPFIGREVPVTVTRTEGEAPELRFVDLVYYPLKEADGTRSGVVAHGSDVTGHVAARQAVERLEERLRLALEAADIGTWDFDLAAGVLSWDARCKAMFGVPPEEEVDYERFLALLHPDDRARTDAAVQAALDPAGSGEYVIEYRAVLPGGGVRWIRASGRGFFAGEGEERRATRFIGTVIDVSRRVESERERDRLLAEAELGRERLQEIFTEAPAVMALYTGP
ncbi:MAG TPA: PAS domain-containing protein, partial [Longimicrobium sp.]|nr:PAS domain-containing protein [Longimicrobium sp.]